MPCTARCPGRPSGSADRTNALDVQHLILREMLDVPSVGFATDLLLIGPLGLASGWVKSGRVVYDDHHTNRGSCS